MTPRPGALDSIARALRSWRTAAVILLSFSSGMPLGLVWIAIPDWMRKSGIDLTTIGLMTLVQAPWTFKFLWSPLLDRYAPPWLGRRRGWMLPCQVLLFALGLALAGLGGHPDLPWVVAALAFGIALASASFDIAYDAYAVDVLRPEEQGVAAGARTALYRGGMYVAGALAITLAGLVSWPLVNVLLAALYLPLAVVTWKAPEGDPGAAAPAPPPRSLREAVWLPFVGFLSRHRALEILAFVLFYKLADNLAGALLRPFLVDKGYSDFDRGLALGTVGLAATLAGSFVGGALTAVLGLGHALWAFGLLQVFSNVGYVLVAEAGVNRPLMYGAMGFESLTQGLGTGAFSVLLLRLTEKRFSATQYALFSSLFGLPRLLSGPVAGVAADGLGWTLFFWLTMAAGVPGLLLLARFVPPGVREPSFTFRDATAARPVARRVLAGRGAAGAVLGLAVALAVRVLVAWLKSLRATGGPPFDALAVLAPLLSPAKPGDWLPVLGTLAFAGVCGLLAAALAAARRGGR